MHSRSLTTHGRIVSVGECMVELAPQGAPGNYAIGFAGDTLNTAWYLRRSLPADWRVDYVTCVGKDAVSERMLGFLADAGIGTAHVARLPDRTVGLYLIELRDSERSFSYWRGESAARLLARDPARLRASLAGADVAYLSGITLAILNEADRRSLLAALTDLRAAGGLVVFDPNLRPLLWPDIPRMCRSIMETAALADIALPSHEDEATAFGDVSAEATARRYEQAGVAVVVVKNGAADVVSLADGVLAQHAIAPVTPVVDTTAAGDSFNAGFLAAHLTGAAMADAVRAGAKVAGHVIAARGALVEGI